jgi:hypothetical protein
LIKEVHYEPNVYAWMALFSACRVYGNVEMVDHIAKQVFELDHGNSARHVLLLDICVNISKLDINEVCSTTKIEKGCEEAFRVELLILMTRAYT